MGKILRSYSLIGGIVYWLVLLCSLAHANIPEDREHLFQVIEMVTHSNASQSSQGLEYLSEFQKYKELPDVILHLIEHELRNQKRHKVIYRLFEILEEVGSRSTVLPPKDYLGDNKVTRFVAIRDSILDIRVHSDPRFRNKGFEALLRRVTDNLKRRPVAARGGSLFKGQDISDSSQFLAYAKEQLAETRRQRSHETPSSRPLSQLQNYNFFEKELLSKVSGDFGSREIKAGEATPYELILAGTRAFITDQVVKDYRNEDYIEIIGRDREVREALLTMAQIQQNNVVFAGPAGEGKTSVVVALAQKILFGNVEGNAVTAFLKNAVIIETSAGSISRLAKTDKPSGQAFAMEAYLKALQKVQEDLGRRIVVFVDEMHNISPEQVEAMKPFMDSKSSKLLFIGASTSREFLNAFKNNEAFLRRFTFIGVEAFTEEMIFKISKEHFIPYLEKARPGLVVPDDTLRFIIKNAIYAFPEKGRIAAAQRLLDNLSNQLLFENASHKLLITEKEVIDFIQSITKLPVDTRDFKAMNAYRKQLIEQIEQDVKGQSRMIRDVVDAWMEVLTNESERGVRVIMLLGRSGVGKTEVVKSFAKHALGGLQHFISIEGNQYQDTNGIGMGVLVGVPGGVSYGKETSGVIPDFVDDWGRGKYKGVILIDEADKANLLFFETLRRVFDEGKFDAGDGKLRVLRRHLVVLTSNSHDKEIFPDDIKNWSLEEIDRVYRSYTQEKLRDLLDRVLPDSIVNRVDRVSLARVIVKDVAVEIAAKIYAAKQAEFKRLAGVELQFDESFFEYFYETYNPLDRGARNFVRNMDSKISEITRKFLGTKDYQKGELLRFSVTREKNQSFIDLNGKKERYRSIFYDAAATPSCRNSLGTNL